MRHAVPLLIIFAAATIVPVAIAEDENDSDASGNFFFGFIGQLFTDFILRVFTGNTIFDKLPPLCLLNFQRCGPLGLFNTMHKRAERGGSCEEVCVAIPFLKFGYDCGGCGEDDGSFVIDLQYTNVPEQDYQFFTDAKEFWESVIIGDTPNSQPNFIIDLIFWAGLQCTLPRQVDDVHICAMYAKMDGSLLSGPNILGGATPLVVTDGFPNAGVMIFDGADLQILKEKSLEEFGDVIRHEM